MTLNYRREYSRQIYRFVLAWFRAKHVATRGTPPTIADLSEEGLEKFFLDFVSNDPQLYAEIHSLCAVMLDFMLRGYEDGRRSVNDSALSQ